MKTAAKKKKQHKAKPLKRTVKHGRGDERPGGGGGEETPPGPVGSGPGKP